MHKKNKHLQKNRIPYYILGILFLSRPLKYQKNTIIIMREIKLYDAWSINVMMQK